MARVKPPRTPLTTDEREGIALAVNSAFRKLKNLYARIVPVFAASRTSFAVMKDHVLVAILVRLFRCGSDRTYEEFPQRAREARDFPLIVEARAMTVVRNRYLRDKALLLAEE